MSYLERLAEGLCDRFAQPLADRINDASYSSPMGAAGRELKRRHDKWFRGLQLNQPYFGVHAKWEWVWLDANDDPFLYCDQRWVFVRKTGVLAYTASGRAPEVSSFRAFEVSPDGLTLKAPQVPPRPEMFHPNAADIKLYGSDMERWTATTHF